MRAERKPPPQYRTRCVDLSGILISMSRSMTPRPRWMAPGTWPRAHSEVFADVNHEGFFFGGEEFLDGGDVCFFGRVFWPRGREQGTLRSGPCEER